jgi:predicted nucleic acid-binding protein
MASRRWVVNASPLILLGKTDNLDLLSALADIVVVPRAIVNEVGAKPDGALILQVLARDPRYCVVDDEAVSPKILSWDSGAGETQAIAHARRHGAERAVIDDMEARRCARAMGLTVIGTLGVVGRAKHRGHIERAAPLIERLRETGLYVTEELVQTILQEVGE